MDKKKKIVMYIVYSVLFILSLIYLFIMYFLNKNDKIKIFNQISLSVQLIALLIIVVSLVARHKLKLRAELKRGERLFKGYAEGGKAAAKALDADSADVDVEY